MRHNFPPTTDIRTVISDLALKKSDSGDIVPSILDRRYPYYLPTRAVRMHTYANSVWMPFVRLSRTNIDRVKDK